MPPGGSTIAPTADLRRMLRSYLSFDQWAVAHEFLSWSLWLLGFPDRAARYHRQALEIAQGLDDAFTLACVLAYGSCVHRFWLDRSEVRADAERALAEGREMQFVSVIALATITRSWTGIADEAETGMKAMRLALEDLRTQLALADRNAFLPMLIEGCIRTCQYDQGLDAVADGLQFVLGTGEAMLEAEFHRLKGELLLVRGSATDAEAS
jgi:hypothetical protein